MWTNRVTPATEFWLLCAVLPWSIDLDMGRGAHLHFPAELLVAWIALRLAAQWRLFAEKWQKMRQIGRIPLALPLVWLLWGWLCVPMSSMDWVSFKYMLIASAHMLVFLGFAVLYPSEWRRGLLYFIVSLSGVALYTMLRHAVYFGMRGDQANLAPMPFFDDHTVYACILLMSLSLAGLVPRRYWLLATPLAMGILLSTCRAAWLSAILALGVMALSALWQWRRWSLLVIFGGGLAFTLLVWPRVSALAQRDVSSAERLNRYHAALRMANERPLMGFGPGTYAYQYIPYQSEANRTRISLDRPIWHRDASNYGHGGGAHSEYLQALAETGWVGMLLLVAMVLLPVFQPPQNRVAWLVLYGWSTYWVHGLLNNYWHDPRAAYLIWGTWSLFFVKNIFEEKKSKNQALGNTNN